MSGHEQECASWASSANPCNCLYPEIHRELAGLSGNKPDPAYCHPKPGIKFDGGKPALDLVDPWFIEDVASVLTSGALKYDVDNWKGGMAIGKAMAAALRHLYAVLKGEYVDPESGKSHLAHATCEIMFIHYFIRNKMTSVRDDRWGRK